MEIPFWISKLTYLHLADVQLLTHLHQKVHNFLRCHIGWKRNFWTLFMVGKSSGGRISWCAVNWHHKAASCNGVRNCSFGKWKILNGLKHGFRHGVTVPLSNCYLRGIVTETSSLQPPRQKTSPKVMPHPEVLLLPQHLKSLVVHINSLCLLLLLLLLLLLVQTKTGVLKTNYPSPVFVCTCLYP